jgi:ribosomal protein S14
VDSSLPTLLICRAMRAELGRLFGLWVPTGRHMERSVRRVTLKFWGYTCLRVTLDILEGVNFNTDNLYTLHSNGPTGGSCSITQQPQNGTLSTTDCAVRGLFRPRSRIHKLMLCRSKMPTATSPTLPDAASTRVRTTTSATPSTPSAAACT